MLLYLGVRLLTTNLLYTVAIKYVNSYGHTGTDM